MAPLALGALAAYLTATVASRLPGQRERHGLAAAWWWLGMFALALHAVLHYTRWQALGGVDLHFFAALSLVTAAMSAITLLLGVNRDSSLLARVHALQERGVGGEPVVSGDATHASGRSSRLGAGGAAAQACHGCPSGPTSRAAQRPHRTGRRATAGARPATR